MLDKKNSTWNNKVYRNCKLDGTINGYCPIHDPDRIERDAATESAKELIHEKAEILKMEDVIVGKTLRLLDPDKFKEILEKSKEAVEIARELRYLHR